MIPPPDEKDSSRKITPDRIALKEHNQLLREADQRLDKALRESDLRLADELRTCSNTLREAIRTGDLALQAERERGEGLLEAARAAALAAALLAVKEKNELALETLANAAEVLAAQTAADKHAANEWRSTVNDIISKMGGMKIMWGVIAGLIGIGFMIWNNVQKNSERLGPQPVAPVQVVQPADAPIPVKPIP